MGKSSKKFVPPLKSSQTINIDENGNYIKKTEKLPKNKKKKLIINFDYAKMKKQQTTSRQAAKVCEAPEDECEIIDDQNTTRGKDSEFMWFEPIQGPSKDSNNHHRTTEGTYESDNSQQHQQISNNSVEGSRQAEDVYLFPSSPAETQKDPECVVCHLEEAEEKKKTKKKKGVKKSGEKSQKSSNKHKKKKVKKQVLKSLFKMGEDMATLRAKEKALQNGQMV